MCEEACIRVNNGNMSSYEYGCGCKSICVVLCSKADVNRGMFLLMGSVNSVECGSLRRCRFECDRAFMWEYISA